MQPMPEHNGITAPSRSDQAQYFAANSIASQDFGRSVLLNWLETIWLAAARDSVTDPEQLPTGSAVFSESYAAVLKVIEPDLDPVAKKGVLDEIEKNGERIRKQLIKNGWEFTRPLPWDKTAEGAVVSAALTI